MNVEESIFSVVKCDICGMKYAFWKGSTINHMKDWLYNNTECIDGASCRLGGQLLD